MMIDYKYKSFVLKTGMHKYISLIDMQYYLYFNYGLIPTMDLDNELADLYNTYGAKFIKECRRINQASFKRIQRLTDRIARYIHNGNCIFLTLTFNDDVLNNSTEITRRKYIQRVLKQHSNMYVANIDYGNDDRYTHREHYHALLVCDWFNKETWNKIGYSWVEVVHKSNSDLIISKYIAKLCNHAIKDSTKRACYIYSRS